MASATSGSEEDFSCSICLDVFNSPVSTPCGHNFCRTCITTFWDDQVQYKCPVCNELFHTRPDLRVNILLSEMVDRFCRTVRVIEPPCIEPGEVPCDGCTGTQLKAVKSCLVCYTSYCQTHLEPHKRVSGLKKHRLIDPLDRLEDRMCKKHNRLLEYFCQTDQVCVCVVCKRKDHKYHPVVPMEEEYELKTANLGKMEAKVQQMIHEREQKSLDINDTANHSKAEADREMANGRQVLTALKHSVEKCLDDFDQTVQEKLKSTEKEAHGLIKELGQEIEDLTNISLEVKQLSHTKDHLHFLQTFRPLKDPPPTRDWTKVEFRPPSYVGTLNKKMKKLVVQEPTLKKCLQSTMDEEREEGGATSKTTLSGEHGRRSKAKRRVQQQRADSPGSSYDSFESDESMEQPAGFKNGRPSREESPEQQQRADSPGSSCDSFESDESMEQPAGFKDGRPSREESVEHGGVGRLRPSLRKYARDLTLDPNTAHRGLSLSEDNRKVTLVGENQSYPEHPERFDFWDQVLGREALTGRCYWEVEREGGVGIGVTYRGITRRGEGGDSRLGFNNKSWSLYCYDDRYFAMHDGIHTYLPLPPAGSTRVGVYLDRPAGSLSFYRVSPGGGGSSDTLTHIHTFCSSFTQEDLLPGVGVWNEGTSVTLCWL